MCIFLSSNMTLQSHLIIYIRLTKYFLLSTTGMLLQHCHLLLRLSYFFMLVWMPWTLKSGDLSVIGMFYDFP